MMKKMIARLLVAMLLVSLCTVGATGSITASAAETSGNYEYEIVNGEATITKYNGTEENVIVPNTLGGYPVTTIGDNAFFFCSSLKTISIPDNVQTIESYAFFFCGSLETVTIPSGVTSIGNRAFDSCYELKAVEVDQSNEVYCDVDGVLFTKDKKTILQYTVGDDSQTYTIPDGVTTIGSGAFYKGYSLNSVIIPDSVITIGGSAFGYCEYMTDITIGKGVKTIGDSAFFFCFLKDIYYKGTQAEWNSIDIALDEGVIGGNKEILDAATIHVNSCIGSADHTYTNACDTSCNVCKATRTITHTYKITTTKATLTKNGSVVKKCSVCGNVASNAAIKYPKMIKLSATSYTYDGKVKTPTVTVKDSAGKTLKKGTDYTVTYAKGCTDVGTYKVTVKMKGNYSGTKTLNFKITPYKVSKCKIKLSRTVYSYNAIKKTPYVSVRMSNGKALKKGTDYTVTYESGRKNVGIYKVTVKLKGNYSGTKTLKFKIIPAAPSITKLVQHENSMDVTITKKSKEVDGYEIYYSRSKSFDNSTIKIVKDSKATKFTLNKLKAGKTYYVRIRTYQIVNGKKLYSYFSTSKSLKMKK